MGCYEVCPGVVSFKVYGKMGSKGGKRVDIPDSFQGEYDHWDKIVDLG